MVDCPICLCSIAVTRFVRNVWIDGHSTDRTVRCVAPRSRPRFVSPCFANACESTSRGTRWCPAPTTISLNIWNKTCFVSMKPTHNSTECLATTCCSSTRRSVFRCPSSISTRTSGQGCSEEPRRSRRVRLPRFFTRTRRDNKTKACRTRGVGSRAHRARTRRANPPRAR